MEDDVADGDDGAISIRYLTKPADIFDLRLSPTHWSSYLSFSHSHKAIFTTTRQPTVQLISISQFMTVIKISVLKSISGLITHPQPPSAPSVRPSVVPPRHHINNFNVQSLLECEFMQKEAAAEDDDK